MTDRGQPDGGVGAEGTVGVVGSAGAVGSVGAVEADGSGMFTWMSPESLSISTDIPAVPCGDQ